MRKFFLFFVLLSNLSLSMVMDDDFRLTKEELKLIKKVFKALIREDFHILQSVNTNSTNNFMILDVPTLDNYWLYHIVKNAFKKKDPISSINEQIEVAAIHIFQNKKKYFEVDVELLAMLIADSYGTAFFDPKITKPFLKVFRYIREQIFQRVKMLKKTKSIKTRFTNHYFFINGKKYDRENIVRIKINYVDQILSVILHDKYGEKEKHFSLKEKYLIEAQQQCIRAQIKFEVIEENDLIILPEEEQDFHR